MPPAVPSRRRRRAARLGTLLVATSALGSSLLACSDGSEGADGRTGGGGTAVDRAGGDRTDSVAALLELVPDTEANRAQVLVARYAAAEDAAALDLTGEGQERELRRLLLLTSDVDAGVGLMGGPLVGGNRAADRYGALGYVPSDLAAEVTAGLPPDQVDIGVGDLDRAEVLEAAQQVEGAERREVGDVEVVGWLDDQAVEPGLETPVGNLPGRAGRVALPADGVLAHATADAAIDEVVATVAGDEPSLADDERFALVAEGLDGGDVHAAYLSTEQVAADPGPITAEPDDGDVADRRAGARLVGYEALGVGAALRDGQPELVVVLVHADEDAAAENAERLLAAAEDGTSTTTGQPWAELLGEPEVDHDGRTVVGRFQVENPTLWYRLVVQRDSLLATS